MKDFYNHDLITNLTKVENMLTIYHGLVLNSTDVMFGAKRNCPPSQHWLPFRIILLLSAHAAYSHLDKGL